MLYEAVWHENREETVEWLSQGGRPDQYRNDIWGGTALMLAAQHGNVDIIRLLLDSGASPLAVDNAGKNAISWAK
jgi:ankyrin repeat protein